MTIDRKRIESLYRILLDRLGLQGWWPVRNRSSESGFDPQGYHPGIQGLKLRERDRFEISIGAVLTQNTAWPNVEKALSRLDGLGIASAKAVLSCPDGLLKDAIRPCGYFNMKARKLKILCGFLESSGALRSGVPPAREDLLGLWGVGPETADSILLYAFGFPVFVIDAYTKRVLSRLGLVEEGIDYPSLQEAISRRLPLDDVLFSEYHALIVAFCKAYCRKAPLCDTCPLRRSCGFAKAGSTRAQEC